MATSKQEWMQCGSPMDVQSEGGQWHPLGRCSFLFTRGQGLRVHPNRGPERQTNQPSASNEGWTTPSMQRSAHSSSQYVLLYGRSNSLVSGG